MQPSIAKVDQPGADNDSRALAVGRVGSATNSRPGKQMAAGGGRSRRYYARQVPNTLADAPNVDDDQRAAADFDSVAIAQLSEFLATGLPPAQRFVVRPSRDTVVVGPQGTRILLPARIWDLPTADSNAVVRLELREFYTAADMLLAGLSTTSGPNLLETGGMLRLTATANGQPVRLRPGRYLHLRMPAKRRKPDMQLFEGVTDGHQQAVDWQLPGEENKPDNLANASQGKRRGRRKTANSLHYPDSTFIARPRLQWPEYKYGFASQLRAMLPQPSRLRRSRHNSRLAQDVLANLSQAYNQRIVRYVSLNFTVDSTGATRHVTARRGSDPELTPIISALLPRIVAAKPAGLPHFVKYRVAYEPVAVDGVVQIDFARSGRVFINQDPSTWRLAKANKARARLLKREVDSLLADKSFTRRYRHVQDSLAVVQRKKHWDVYQAEQARLRTQFTDTSRADITQLGVYNELSAQGMGWMNCDRFLKENNLITLKVETPGKAAITSLLFEDLNSVMQGLSFTGNVTMFDNVPARRRATVVAIKREGGTTYLATQRLVISTEPVSGLQFHPVTMAQLRAELDQLQ